MSEWQTVLGVSLVVVHCHAPDSVLEARLARRAEAGGDPSEATVEVLALQRTRFEPPQDDEPVIRVDMAGELTDAVVDGLVRDILSR